MSYGGPGENGSFGCRATGEKEEKNKMASLHGEEGVRVRCWECTEPYPTRGIVRPVTFPVTKHSAVHGGRVIGQNSGTSTKFHTKKT